MIRHAWLATLPLLAACAASNPNAPTSATCESPAPVRNVRDLQTPDIFVSFKTGVDGSAAVSRLQSQLDFTVLWQPSAQTGFLAALTDDQIATIRCDSAVSFLEWNSAVSVGARAPVLRRRRSAAAVSKRE